MLIGRDITIEVAGRKLVSGGELTIGPKDKVGLVGANGAGKSSLLSFVLAEVPRHLRARGSL